MKNQSEHQFLQRIFFIAFFKDGILHTEREKGMEDNVYFLLFEAFSLAASILKYSSTSSIGISFFFFFCIRGFILNQCFTRFRRSFFL